MQPIEIQTRDALAITRMPVATFRMMMDNGNYKIAPPADATRRIWEIDDLVALWYCRTLLLGGMGQPMAGQWAALLAEAIQREPKAKTYYAYVWENPDGVRGHGTISSSPPAEAPDARILQDIPIAKLRRDIRAAVNAFYERRDAQRARKH
jgi:hypothetical protein